MNPMSPYSGGLVAPPIQSFASNATQLAALAASSLAVLSVAVVTEHYVAAGFAEAALLGGIAVGGLTGASDRVFRSIPAWGAGLLGGVLALIAWSITAANLRGSMPVGPEVVLYVALFLAGLDWQRADRLRAIVVLSGVALVPTLVAGGPASVGFGLAWFAAVAVSLWLVERDIGRWSWRIVPAGPVSPASVGSEWSRVAGLLRVAGSAAIVAVACALVFGGLSCEQRRDVASGQTGAGRSSGGGTYGGGNYGGGARTGAGGGRISRDDAGPEIPTRPRAPGGDVAGGSGGAGARGDASSPPTPPDLDTVKNVLLVVLAVGVAAVLIALGYRAIKAFIDRRKQKAQRTPAHNLLERLMEEGRKRGRPRRPCETVAQYAAALAASVLPDPRLVQVGDVLSAAYFAPAAPGPETLLWAERVVEEAAALDELAD
jgi:hypothetical protein